MDTYKLTHGEAFPFLVTLGADSVDALITDPPYSSGGLHAGERTNDSTLKKYGVVGVSFDGDSKDQRSWTRWCSEWLSLCRIALREGSPFAVFADWRQLPALTDAVQMADLVWRGIAVWDKTASCRPQRGRPRNQAEYIVWGSKGAMPLSRRAPTLDGVHREYQHRRDKHHVTGKPVGVMRWLCSLCEPSGLILDPFAGSGSTGVAALLDGYRFTGVERDPRYFAVAERRLQAAASGEVLSSVSDRAIGEAARSLLRRRRSVDSSAVPATGRRKGSPNRLSVGRV